MSKLKRITSAIRAKLSSEQGETLVETLVSTLVIVGVFVMLCTAIVSAAKVSTAVTPSDVVFRESEGQSAAVTVWVEDASGNTIKTLPVNGESNSIAGKVQNGYVFYDYKR